ncbi:hypothetical protein ANN_26838 [Periplaneta americana]|uniref:Transcription factor IIIC subunit Tfc1/Sfc1 triple barrel domain-containing protein n=1 Tax=Periplaneta americana TaxID=6978 RepID=A0ABQ8RZG7_PERAM|nr:hypothetical protein ANN_26838 [Periplaneta americana]
MISPGYVNHNTMNTEDEIDIHRFDRKLILVEYPGVVENEEKAIRTLGGLQNISTTYSLRNRRLELRFRPDDAFSKPACGDKHKTLSLLLKIKIRRKKKNEQLLCDSSAEDSDSSSSVCSDESTNTRCSIVVMGRIETAYRFKNLCDFQYLTMNPEFGDHGQMVCKYDSLVPIGLPTASWLAGSAPYFLPPATFSRMDTMQVYKWFSHFKSGNMSTEDMPCPGHPSTGRNDENIAKIKCAIAEDRRKTIDEVSEQTNLS